LRITNPAGSWNKYKKVTFDRQSRQVLASYGILLGNPEDCDFDYEIDVFTPEEFVVLCGFDSMEHYKAMRDYIENKPVKFQDLRQGMVVWSEALRNRYTILQKKDSNTVYVRQHNTGWMFGKKKVFLTRDEVDTWFFKKSKEVNVWTVA